MGEGQIIEETSAGVPSASETLLWGQHFWARGYFCASSGTVTDEMIKAYLEDHGLPEGKPDFQVEVPE